MGRLRRNILIVFLLTFISVTSLAQPRWKSIWTYEPSKWAYAPKFSLITSFGYNWQGINTYEVGLRLLPFAKDHQNVSIILNALLFQHGAMYIAPEIMLRYFRPIPLNKEHPAITFSCSYWSSKVLGNQEKTLTPEIGLSIYTLYNVSYGYNIPLTNLEQSFISRNRIALRLIFR